MSWLSKIKNIYWSLKPFNVFDVWQQEEGVKELVKKTWEGYSGNIDSLKALKEKFKVLKSELEV